ncbi:MAG: hypothetical protein B7Z06_00220 [Flavobacteriales bacterium 32-35-8]|nr:MAG: hypothetical protein B7Z06_00220 [Flavobacteriales bacterium 32-35-8]
MSADLTPAISRFPVPELDALPEDLRARILAVQEKSGFIPNVFLTLAHRPDEFRAFFVSNILGFTQHSKRFFLLAFGAWHGFIVKPKRACKTRFVI